MYSKRAKTFFPVKGLRSTDSSVLHKNVGATYDSNNGSTYTINVEETVQATADGTFNTSNTYHETYVDGEIRLQM